MSSSFARQRRRLAEAVDRVDLVVRADKKYFERFGDRHHRLRTASQAEVDAIDALHGPEARLRPGFRWYCLVRQIEPGSRLRHYVPNEIGMETELPEHIVQAIYDHCAPKGSQAADVEASVRSILHKPKARK